MKQYKFYRNNQQSCFDIILNYRYLYQGRFDLFKNKVTQLTLNQFNRFSIAKYTFQASNMEQVPRQLPLHSSRHGSV